MTRSPKSHRAGVRLVVPATLALTALVGACQTTETVPEGIGFREARFEEISAMQTYRGCVDDAAKLNQEARSRNNPGGYLASARLYERCESELGPEARNLAQEERMRAYAISILNYLKGGDVQASRTNLETFKRAFAGYDLYLPDGASFVDTMDLLTGGKAVPSPYGVSLLNVSPDVKAELQRVRFWKVN